MNTLWSGLMVDPGLVNKGDHDVLICGNDKSAKEKVMTLLKSFGWNKNNIIDLGDITASRGTEMYLLLWLRLLGTFNTVKFNIKIIR
jgi:predicted dinucleotide-binding enzyme